MMPTRDELLDELIAELTEPEIPEGAITVRMLVEQSGRTEKMCRALLNQKVKDGKMDYVTVGYTKFYYSV